ncbi:MAG: hypothetical protein R3345_04200 [Fulvivirga sp.]|nr:hypothetical protein [Fulvivirga sp.]
MIPRGFNLKQILATFLLACLISTTLEAQKVKYKDLYPLLAAKKYEQAEPFLRQFIQDEKNRDKYPNSLLQMAFVYHEKALNDDVLLETDQLKNHVDSAVYYYQWALKMIDDKAVRKNDEYYLAYKRRDVRTGKFGINLGDVQFDIEEKIKALKGREEKVTTLAGFFNKSQQAYDSALRLYRNIKNEYATEKRLLLRLNDQTSEEMNQLKSAYVTAVENFKSYKNTLNDIDRVGYNQDLLIKEIVDFEEDGVAGTDLTKDNVAFWDYSKWVDDVRSIHTDEILPLFEELIAFDQQFRDLIRKSRNDTVAIANIPSITGVAEFERLKEFDEDPMPFKIFSYQQALLGYTSLQATHKDYQDTTDIMYKLDVLESKVDQLNKMDSLINLLLGVNVPEETKNYHSYVKAQYGEAEDLQGYIKSQLDFVIEEKRAKEAALEQAALRSEWLIVESDSIPLKMPETFGEDFQLKYAPLLVDSLLTAGLYFSTDTTAQGYIADVNPARQPVMFEFFEVDSVFRTRDAISMTEVKSLSLLGESDSIYFVIFYAPMPEQESFEATVVRASSEGTLWTKNLILAAIPGTIAYNVRTDEIIINYEMPDFGGSDQELVGNKIVFSKDGEIQDGS